MKCLKDLKEKKGLSFIFICHNLALVQMFCDRVIVMHDGQVEEEGTPEELMSTNGIYRHMTNLQMQSAGWKIQ